MSFTNRKIISTKHTLGGLPSCTKKKLSQSITQHWRVSERAGFLALEYLPPAVHHDADLPLYYFVITSKKFFQSFFTRFCEGMFG